MEVIWRTFKVVNEQGVITHIDWEAEAYSGVVQKFARGRVALDSPSPEAVSIDVARRENPGDESDDKPGYTRHEWVERDKLHPWLFEKIDRAAIEADLIAQVKAL